MCRWCYIRPAMLCVSLVRCVLTGLLYPFFFLLFHFSLSFLLSHVQYEVDSHQLPLTLSIAACCASGAVVWHAFAACLSMFSVQHSACVRSNDCCNHMLLLAASASKSGSVCQQAMRHRISFGMPREQLEKCRRVR